MGLFRLLLAWSVLLGHGGHGFFGLGFLHRDLAVQSFFVVSGFYMALILNEKYIGSGRYGIFLQQRILRLFPTYLIILVLILLIEGAITAWTHQPYGSLKYWSDYFSVMPFSTIAFLGLMNLVIFGQDMNAFFHVDMTTGQLAFALVQPPNAMPSGLFLLNGPSWSLAVELLFYVVAPLLVCRSWRLQFAALLASAALRVAFHYFFGRENHWIYLFGPSNLYFFFAGSLGYLFYKNHRSRTEDIVRNHPWIFWAFFAIVVTYNRIPFTHSLYWIYLPLVAIMVPLLFAATRSNRTDRLIGELSYPFYLLHMQVLYLWNSFFTPEQLSALAGPICVAVTMLASWFFYRFIELRTEHFRERLYENWKNRRTMNPAPAFSPQATAAE